MKGPGMHVRKTLATVGVGAGLIGAVFVGPAAADEGAVHFKSCPEGLNLSTLGGFRFSHCYNTVTAPSGNANLHSHGQLLDPATAPAKTTTVENFACLAGSPAYYGVTTDTRMVVTPSGKVNITCKFHPSE